MKSRMKICVRAFIVLLLGGLSGCVKGQVLRAKVADIEAKLVVAQKPAMRCAARDLAKARAHLKFTLLELEQGALLRASEHMIVAEKAAKVAQGMQGRPECEEDKDGDGIIDTKDQCPEQPEDFDGFEMAMDAPEDQDTDGDGILDSRDRCPREPEDKDGVEDEDGCPDLTKDRDGDGFLDEVDACPDKPEDKDGFEDGDGCPDTDNDKDKIPDSSIDVQMNPRITTTTLTKMVAQTSIRPS